MQNPQTWRELLGKVIRDPQEKQNLANKLGINPLTLMRWVSGESMPRPHNLRQLFLALPTQCDQLRELLTVELDEYALETREPPCEIPSSLYARVLSEYANLPRALRFKSICDLLLQEALGQFDPCQRGIEITIVQCMKPGADGLVRSLRESIGRGTPPWRRELEQRTCFLGSESLAGYVVASGRPFAIQRDECSLNLFPVYWIEEEKSAMAYPLLSADRIAGCLLLSSTQPDFFVSTSCRILVQRYAELIALLCDPADFCALEDIDLVNMLPLEEQYPYIAEFRERVSTIARQKRSSVLEAEPLAWQEIELSLLRRANSTRSYASGF